MEIWLLGAVIVGTAIWWLSNKLEIPDVLPLLLAGWVLSFYGASVDPTILAIISSVALGLVIFDGFAHLNLRELDTFGWRALKLMLANAAFVVIAVTIIANGQGLSLLNSLLLGTVLIGISPAIVFTLGNVSRVVELVKLERVLGAPLTVILPFVIVSGFSAWQAVRLPDVTSVGLSFANVLIVGIGTGVVLGLVLLRILHKLGPRGSYVLLLVTIIFAFVLAERLGGSGVLAVATLGVFIGASSFKQKVRLLANEGVLARCVHVVVFILLGMTLVLPAKAIWVHALIICAVLWILRFITYRVVVTSYEAVIGSLLGAKGLPTAAVVFALATQTGTNLISITTAVLVITVAGAWLATFITRSHAY